MSTSPSDAAPGPGTTAPVPADYFDGRGAKAWRVALSLRGGVLSTVGEGIARDDPVNTLRVSEPMGAAPRIVTFADGSHCEIRDHAAFRALLAAGGHNDRLVVRLQDRWRWAVASVALTLFVLVAGYVWGLPALAAGIARALPEAAVARIGSDAASFMDRGVFAPTRLDAARQQHLRAAFDRMVAPGGRKPGHRILFRDGGRIGANALALPDGTIFVTDQLVALAGRDEEILAVLAHELGHVEHRHGLRMLIQGSIVGFVVAWVLGDVSSVAAGLPSALLEARYSRDFEREADHYAADLLRANGLSTEPLASILERMEHGRDGPPRSRDGAPRGEEGIGGYLSSHPATRERIDALRRQAAR